MAGGGLLESCPPTIIFQLLKDTGHGSKQNKEKNSLSQLFSLLHLTNASGPVPKSIFFRGHERSIEIECAYFKGFQSFLALGFGMKR